jgi:hypothetical protein
VSILGCVWSCLGSNTFVIFRCAAAKHWAQH